MKETANRYLFQTADKLYVSTDHVALPEVQSEVARILRDVSLTLETCSLQQLREYQQGQHPDMTLGKHAGNNSQEQNRVLGYFREALKQHSSDIHFRIGEKGLTRILYRIHGELSETGHLETAEGYKLARTIIHSMCDDAEPSFHENRPQSARLRKEFLRQVGLFGARYEHYPTEFGLLVVMRLISDDGDNPSTLSALGFLPEQTELFEQMLMTPEGMMLISGPTGSGKSTTLRTLCRMYIDGTNGTRHLLTFEDPVEGGIVDAVQCGIKADRSNPEAVSQAWSSALSSGMRLDPDAILVGEQRDRNSAMASIIAALTGHIVLSTVHTPDAIRILDRLIETFNISASLVIDPQVMIGLVSQRLIQQLCPHCKLNYAERCGAQSLQPLTALQKNLLAEHTDTQRIAFRHPDGCTHCKKGFTGRQVIAEVIRPNAMFMDMNKRHGKLQTRSYWVHYMQGITRRAHLQSYLDAGTVDPLHANFICPLDEDNRLLLPKEAVHV
ncbi:type II secretion protein E [Citrobacter amalonaticus]|uniref:Type II secretion protein E n=1 Tax=Citrobacter amalonaticus TaxID=35703 RepID=A0A2S4RR58_CITAM|nr:ATPase, T2SS/T4P/T4SS family [Citrobacter amalonaticus]EAN2420058.1 type II secretion protein E [Salmonella enterica]EJF4177080.1 Flp pilus assembly complex ATPase component TadA [Salmonella enterica]POT54665.1 type II secretion protein E [Citrobacter amalonaticus]POT69874.1 type II secretion protein E [Citrobacter amalonaticus]POU61133.1 type II secretion protein E [Citrobacter amalonaticus]